MSTVMMESFQRFELGDFDFATKRPIQTDNEWREFAGNNAVADTTNGQYAANVAYHTMGIYQDPIIASKKRLGFAINPPNAGQNQSGGGVYGLERLFTAPRTKYVVGFLARFKLGSYFTPGTSYNAPQMFEFCAAGRNRLVPSANMQLRYFVVGGTNTAAQSVFGADNGNRPTTNWAAMSDAAVGPLLPPTFRMKGAADPNAAGIQLKYDTDHFFEVEVDITNKTLKVWVDDIYAGLATWNDTYDLPLANGFQIRHGYCFGQNFVPTADLGGVYISDIYCNDMSDTVVPNTRLGKTTRVMGESPDTDVSTMFVRPDTFNSNNDVINDPIANTATPPNFLSGDGAGTEDMYQTANSIIGQFAGQVYAVQIHARYQNASGSSHTMAITSQDATTKTENSLGNVAAGSGIQMKSVVLNKTPSGENWTPAKAAALKYGFKIVN